MGLLDGKVALVTGAGGGLGRAYALLFAQEGAKVVVNDLGGTRDGAGGGNAMADQVVAEIKEAGGEAIANYASVSDEEGAQSIVNDAVNTWGRLDICVNNAGILRDKTLLKLDTPNFDLVMAVHARGTFLVGKASAEAMKAAGNGGSIINTSSIAGLKGNFGQTNYACAKAGIYGMTLVWSQELSRAGIRSNAIAPMAKTRMTDDIDAVPDDVTPEMIAPVALYLASDLSSDVNGRIFGAHGKHVFEYHMKLSPGVEKDSAWTAAEIADQIKAISELPSAKAPADGGAGNVGDVINEVFDRMPDFFLADRAGSWTATLHFNIEGTGSWTVNVADGKCTSGQGAPPAATCTINYNSSDIFLGTITGKMKPEQAFMAGDISADNMGDLMKFAKCFDMKKAQEAASAAEGGGGNTIEDAINESFTRMPEFFMADRAGSWSATLHFNIEGTGSWGVSVSDGTCTSSTGKPDGATCNITYKSADIFLGTVTGKMKAEQAFMAGDIAADNMGDLMKFAQCFDMKKAQEAAAAKSAGDSEAPKAEGMNRDCVGRNFNGAVEFVYPENALAYAESTNDLNDHYKGDDAIAPVLYPVRPFIKVLSEAVVDPELNADLMRLVHGEQDMRFHDTIKPWDLVCARSTILDIETKSSGELLKVRQRLMRDGEVVCDTVSGFFIRGKKKADGGSAKPKAEAPPAPSHDLIYENSFTVDDDQSYRYAESSLDKNPIHVNENTAKAAGHPGVIAHGLCTMAMTGRDLINHYLDGNPARLKRLKVRFSAIVLPGDTLTTRAWVIEKNDNITTLGLETVNQHGKAVINNALAEVSDS